MTGGLKSAKVSVDMLTVRQVAERLAIHPTTAYRLIYQGRLRAVKIGRVVRVKEEDLEQFIALLPAPPGGKEGKE